MKFNSTFFLVIISFFLVACSSSKKEEYASEKRELKKDYSLIDASSERLPMWVLKKESGLDKKELRNYRYFLSEGEHESKRICMRSSSARANAKVAGEIARFIKNTYSEATEGGTNQDVNEYMSEQLAEETQSFVIGSEVVKNYWEKRKYQEDLGARYDDVRYHCVSLVRVPKSSLEKAIKASRKKLIDNIDDLSTKNEAKEALKDIEDKLDEV